MTWGLWLSSAWLGWVCWAAAAVTSKALIIAVEITATALRFKRGNLEEARTKCRVEGFSIFSATVDISFHPTQTPRRRIGDAVA